MSELQRRIIQRLTKINTIQPGTRLPVATVTLVTYSHIQVFTETNRVINPNLNLREHERPKHQAAISLDTSNTDTLTRTQDKERTDIGVHGDNSLATRHIHYDRRDSESHTSLIRSDTDTVHLRLLTVIA